MYGVDISAHQAADTVKQLAAKGKASFVITRNSCGSYTPDSDLAAFMADINRYGLKNSAYVASYAKDEAEAVEEADFLVSLVEKYGNRPELPLFFDWEYFSADYIKKQFGIIATKDLVQKITAAFCERIKEHGYTAGVYCNLDFMQRFYTPEFWAAHPDYKLWYARPGLAQPDKDCYLWQYASNNGLDDFGYNGDIDKNILYGEYVEEIEPMKPLSSEPVRMYIGFASPGDIHTLTVKLEGLGIPVEEKDGYIITGYMSGGDQCYIMTDCHRLGILYEIYKDPEDEDKPSTGEDKPPINEDRPTIDEEGAEQPPEDEVQQPDSETDSNDGGEPPEENRPGLLALLVKAIIEFLKGVFKV